jgi:hypothetical protein
VRDILYCGAIQKREPVHLTDAVRRIVTLRDGTRGTRDVIQPVAHEILSGNLASDWIARLKDDEHWGFVRSRFSPIRTTRLPGGWLFATASESVAFASVEFGTSTKRSNGFFEARWQRGAAESAAGLARQ